MTRDEWHQLLAVEPATANQVGALHREFARLGYRPGERAERLEVSAALLGVGPLTSLRDLRQGQAGKLLHLLLTVADRGELLAPVPVAEPDPAAPSLLAAVVAAIATWPPGFGTRNATRNPHLPAADRTLDPWPQPVPPTSGFVRVLAAQSGFTGGAETPGTARRPAGHRPPRSETQPATRNR